MSRTEPVTGAVVSGPTNPVLDDIQGHVFRPIKGHRTSIKLFIDIDATDVPSLLDWLIRGGWLRTMTQCRAELNKPNVVVGLTHPALLALGGEYRPLLLREDNARPESAPSSSSSAPGGEQQPVANFRPDPFEQGMRARRRLLGDPKTDHTQIDDLDDASGPIYVQADQAPTAPVANRWSGYDKGLLLWISTPASIEHDCTGDRTEFPDPSKMAADTEPEKQYRRVCEQTQELTKGIREQVSTYHREFGFWFPIDPKANGEELDQNKLLMGFPDGTGQPYVSEFATIDSARTLAGGGTPRSDGWQPVPLGEFVLGQRDASGATEAPGPAWLMRNGTFLVYRKYDIFSERYEHQLEQAQAKLGRERGQPIFSVEDLAAKTMGRYRAEAMPAEATDSVVTSSNGTTGEEWLAREPENNNDFRFDLDTTGHLCPLGAHARRSNPRDTLGFDGSLVARHRLFRRGSFRTIRTQDADQKKPALQELHFVAINARIVDGYEFVQRRWLNTGHSFRLGDQPDLFVGARSEGKPVRLLIQGERPVLFESEAPLSEFKGGEYFFIPAKPALEALIGYQEDHQ